MARTYRLSVDADRIRCLASISATRCSTARYSAVPWDAYIDRQELPVGKQCAPVQAANAVLATTATHGGIFAPRKSDLVMHSCMPCNLFKSGRSTRVRPHLIRATSSMQANTGTCRVASADRTRKPVQAVDFCQLDRFPLCKARMGLVRRPVSGTHEQRLRKGPMHPQRTNWVRPLR